VPILLPLNLPFATDHLGPRRIFLDINQLPRAPVLQSA
jgi:hypothetical protein